MRSTSLGWSASLGTAASGCRTFMRSASGAFGFLACPFGFVAICCCSFEMPSWDRRRATSHGLPPCPGAWTRNAGTEQTVPFRGQTSSHTGCIARALQPVAPGSPALGKTPAVGYGFGIAPCSRALDSLGEKSHAMGDLDVEGLAPWMASWSGLTPSWSHGGRLAWCDRGLACCDRGWLSPSWSHGGRLACGLTPSRSHGGRLAWSDRGGLTSSRSRKVETDSTLKNVCRAVSTVHANVIQ